MKLNTKQLRKLAGRLKLVIPKVFSKQQLQRQITSSLISSSRDRKIWAQTSKNIRYGWSPPKVEGKTHWTPSKDCPVLKTGGADCMQAILREQNNLSKTADGLMEVLSSVNAHGTFLRGLRLSD